MNERITEIYRSCKTKEALKSQEIYDSADVLLGSEVEKFAEELLRKCIDIVGKATASPNGYQAIMEYFGIEEPNEH